MDVNVQAARPRTRILCPTRGALGRAPSEVWAGGRGRDGARTERERCERCFAEEEEAGRSSKELREISRSCPSGARTFTYSMAA